METPTGFDYSQSVSIYPDNGKLLRNDLFFDIEGEATGITLAIIREL